MSEEEQQPQAGAGEDLLPMIGQSQLYTATEDTLFTKNIPALSKTHSLSIEWVFGMNPALPAFSQQDDNQLVVLYAGAHFGVIYNHTLNSQYILQGHCHSISCMCVSGNRRWIATADQGPKSVVVMWDSYSGIPVQTLFNCHPKGGVTAMALSSNTQLLVTLGGEEIQRVCIWEWMDETERPIWYTELNPKHGFQGNIIFNPNDNTQLLSSSESHVLFYNTALKEQQVTALAHKKLCKTAPGGCDDAPDISQIVNLAAGSLSTSVFHCKEPLILTATTAGSLLIWDVSIYLTANKILPKAKCKNLPLQNAPITCLTTTDSYIVTGDTEGHIIFYDEEFKLLIRYNKFRLDTIISISFSKESTERPLDDCSVQAEPRIIRNFVVTTVSSIVHVKALESKTQLLLQKDCEPVRAVHCHPKQSTVAMGNGDGVLKVWDYNTKRIVCSRAFENADIRCIAFDSQGQNLAVGFESGAVHILDPHTLQSSPDDCLHYSIDSIHLLAFSSDSNYFATGDVGNAVTVFRQQADEESLQRWTYVGRYHSHYKPIRELLFGVHPNSGQPRLLSLGMDRRVVEYDLENSTVDDLLILSSVCIEQTAVPTCMAWYPPLTAEQFLLTASDQYKMKLFDSISMMCRKTILGPTYGTPVDRVSVLPKLAGTNTYYLAFITEDKLGLQILPLDGNPYKSNALICHPSGTSALTCSYDGQFVFTAGASDCTVQSWEFNLNALEAAAALGGTDMAPFYTMLDGGRDGAFYNRSKITASNFLRMLLNKCQQRVKDEMVQLKSKEMEQLFFYCQIHSQGIDTMERRQISTKIPVSEVASLMRALAYFPTNKEVMDIENEIKFSKFAETGKYVTDINLEDFIKLYVNHRPAFGICNEVMQAIHVLGNCDSKGQRVLQKRELLKMLEDRGEFMTEEEVWQCFTTLLSLDEKEEEEKQGVESEQDPQHAGATSGGEHSEHPLELMMPDQISVEDFVFGILGCPSSAEPSGSPTS